MVKTPARLLAMVDHSDYAADIKELITETEFFTNPDILFEQLKSIALSMIQHRTDPSLALKLLFDPEKSEDREKGAAQKGYGNLSIIFDSDSLGHSSISKSFTENLNRALLEAPAPRQEFTGKDAFGNDYSPVREPMPKIKLAAGFEVILRTMHSDATPALTRYGLTENSTYPLSAESRAKYASALSWIGGSKEKEGVTWVRTGNKDEALYVYPYSIKEDIPTSIRLFSRQNTPGAGRVKFETEAETFIKAMHCWADTDPGTYPDTIQIFLLRKINKGQTRVVYNSQISPERLMECGKRWSSAAQNIPSCPHLFPDTPFPLDIVNVLNQAWKSTGKIILDHYKPVDSFHGIELQLSATKELASRDLYLMVRNFDSLVLYAGNQLHRVSGTLKEKDRQDIADIIIVTGMLLYWLDERKEEYMNSYAYLLGQLLKLADQLHELYCYEVRDNKMPAQLMGCSFYNAAMEMPQQALAQLGQRMSPYIGWARTHRDAQVKEGEGKKGYKASSIIWMMENITKELGEVFTTQTRFSDTEKAELFLGYMAAFPRMKQENENSTVSE